MPLKSYSSKRNRVRSASSIIVLGFVFALMVGFQNCSGFATAHLQSSSLPSVSQITGQQSFAGITFSNPTSYFTISNAQTGNFGYAYGPSIIYTQGVYHAYFCSGGGGSIIEWDDVRHETSTDLINWSAPDKVIRPAAIERAACDPSIVRYDAGDGLYYYLFYSGNITGVQTVNYVARSTSPSGPFLKYTDRNTWEAAPTDPHVITWPFKNGADGSNAYGAGEPSLVVHNGMLYNWYTNSDESGRPNGVYLTTSRNAVQWSTPVYTNIDDVSVDVKFDPTSQLFVMVEVTPQLSTSAQLTMRTSVDGITWSSPQILCDANCLPDYASNPGMSGDDQGQLLVGKPTLIGFGAPYNLTSPTYVWGEWNLWGQLFNLQISNLAPAATVATTSSSAAAIIPPGDVKGIVDGVVANSDGSATIKGWACAIYNPNSIQVALYLGPSASAAGIGWFPASTASEPAIATQCQSTGTAYRFVIPVSSALVSQYAGKAVHVFGISPWGLANLELSNPTAAVLPAATAAAAAPVAAVPATSAATTYPAVASHNVLGIFGVDSSGVISGWACVTGLSDSIPIHFYVGGPAGVGAFAAATTANLSNETAVNQQCSSNGSFRFQIVMDPNWRNTFRGQSIYIYGISTVGGSNNLLANSGTFVVP